MFSFLLHITLRELFQLLIVVWQTTHNSVFRITVIYSFSQFYGSGLQRELIGQFFLPLTLVGGQSFSLVQYDWAGLEMPRRFYSVIRWPSASHVTSPRSCSSFVLSHNVVACGWSGLSHGSWFPRGKKKKPPILLSLGLGSPRSRHTTSSALKVTRLPQNSKGGETGPICSKGGSGHVHMGKEKNDGGHLRDHSFTSGSWRRLRCEALTLPRRTHRYGYVPKVSSVEAWEVKILQQQLKGWRTHAHPSFSSHFVIKKSKIQVCIWGGNWGEWLYQD